MFQYLVKLVLSGKRHLRVPGVPGVVGGAVWHRVLKIVWGFTLAVTLVILVVFGVHGSVVSGKVVRLWCIWAVLVVVVIAVIKS